MAEAYPFSDDEEGGALLDRAYDRWEQLGGAAARGPLFQFTMQPIGRRRRWRDVVERAQFNAQLLNPKCAQCACLKFGQVDCLIDMVLLHRTL